MYKLSFFGSLLVLVLVFCAGCDSSELPAPHVIWLEGEDVVEYEKADEWEAEIQHDEIVLTLSGERERDILTLQTTGEELPRYVNYEIRMVDGGRVFTMSGGYIRIQEWNENGRVSGWIAGRAGARRIAQGFWADLSI